MNRKGWLMNMNRHRFEGDLMWPCLAMVPGATDANPDPRCNAFYATPGHYRDDDHPFYGEGTYCAWLMQDPAAREARYCSRLGTDTVHSGFPTPPPAPDETVVLRMERENLPPSGWTQAADGRFCSPTVGDAPAEDGGSEGTWAYAGPLGAVEGPPEGYAARAAWNLDHAQPVPSGPWPVRQWYAADGGAPEWWENPGELICALNVTGEPFLVETWWADPATRLVRVTWGRFLGMEVGELYRAVETWE